MKNQILALFSLIAVFLFAGAPHAKAYLPSYHPHYNPYEIFEFASTNYTIPYTHDKPKLAIAAREGDAKTVRRLLKDHQVDVNEAETYGGWTALHEAAKSGSVDTAATLLEAEADIEKGADDRRTPLCSAAKRPSVQMVALLADWGANFEASCDDGMTPLQLAIHHDQDDVAIYLIENGANTEALNDRGETPLHETSRHGNINIARALLQHGAWANPANENGQTPRDVCVDEAMCALLDGYASSSWGSYLSSYAWPVGAVIGFGAFLYQRHLNADNFKMTLPI